MATTGNPLLQAEQARWRFAQQLALEAKQNTPGLNKASEKEILKAFGLILKRPEKEQQVFFENLSKDNPGYWQSPAQAKALISSRLNPIFRPEELEKLTPEDAQQRLVNSEFGADESSLQSAFALANEPTSRDSELKNFDAWKQAYTTKQFPQTGAAKGERWAANVVEQTPGLQAYTPIALLSGMREILSLPEDQKKTIFSNMSAEQGAYFYGKTPEQIEDEVRLNLRLPDVKSLSKRNVNLGIPSAVWTDPSSYVEKVKTQAAKAVKDTQNPTPNAVQWKQFQNSQTKAMRDFAQQLMPAGATLDSIIQDKNQEAEDAKDGISKLIQAQNDFSAGSDLVTKTGKVANDVLFNAAGLGALPEEVKNNPDLKYVAPNTTSLEWAHPVIRQIQDYKSIDDITKRIQKLENSVQTTTTPDWAWNNEWAPESTMPAMGVEADELNVLKTVRDQFSMLPKANQTTEYFKNLVDKTTKSYFGNKEVDRRLVELEAELPTLPQEKQAAAAKMIETLKTTSDKTSAILRLNGDPTEDHLIMQANKDLMARTQQLDAMEKTLSQKYPELIQYTDALQDYLESGAIVEQGGKLVVKDNSIRSTLEPLYKAYAKAQKDPEVVNYNKLTQQFYKDKQDYTKALTDVDKRRGLVTGGDVNSALTKLNFDNLDAVTKAADVQNHIETSKYNTITGAALSFLGLPKDSSVWEIARATVPDLPATAVKIATGTILKSQNQNPFSALYDSVYDEGIEDYTKTLAAKTALLPKSTDALQPIKLGPGLPIPIGPLALAFPVLSVDPNSVIGKTAISSVVDASVIPFLNQAVDAFGQHAIKDAVEALQTYGLDQMPKGKRDLVLMANGLTEADYLRKPGEVQKQLEQFVKGMQTMATYVAEYALTDGIYKGAINGARMPFGLKWPGLKNLSLLKTVSPETILNGAQLVDDAGNVVGHVAEGAFVRGADQALDITKMALKNAEGIELATNPVGKALQVLDERTTPQLIADAFKKGTVSALASIPQAAAGSGLHVIAEHERRQTPGMTVEYEDPTTRKEQTDDPLRVLGITVDPVQESSTASWLVAAAQAYSGYATENMGGAVMEGLRRLGGIQVAKDIAGDPIALAKVLGPRAQYGITEAFKKFIADTGWMSKLKQMGKFHGFGGEMSEELIDNLNTSLTEAISAASQGKDFTEELDKQLKQNYSPEQIGQLALTIGGWSLLGNTANLVSNWKNSKGSIRERLKTAATEQAMQNLSAQRQGVAKLALAKSGLTPDQLNIVVDQENKKIKAIGPNQEVVLEKDIVPLEDIHQAKIGLKDVVFGTDPNTHQEIVTTADQAFVVKDLDSDLQQLPETIRQQVLVSMPETATMEKQVDNEYFQLLLDNASDDAAGVLKDDLLNNRIRNANGELVTDKNAAYRRKLDIVNSQVPNAEAALREDTHALFLHTQDKRKAELAAMSAEAAQIQVDRTDPVAAKQALTDYGLSGKTADLVMKNVQRVPETLAEIESFLNTNWGNDKTKADIHDLFTRVKTTLGMADNGEYKNNQVTISLNPKYATSREGFGSASLDATLTHEITHGLMERYFPEVNRYLGQMFENDPVRTLALLGAAKTRTGITVQDYLSQYASKKGAVDVNGVYQPGVYGKEAVAEFFTQALAPQINTTVDRKAFTRKLDTTLNKYLKWADPDVREAIRIPVIAMYTLQRGLADQFKPLYTTTEYQNKKNIDPKVVAATNSLVNAILGTGFNSPGAVDQEIGDTQAKYDETAKAYETDKLADQRDQLANLKIRLDELQKIKEGFSYIRPGTEDLQGPLSKVERRMSRGYGGPYQTAALLNIEAINNLRNLGYTDNLVDGQAKYLFNQLDKTDPVQNRAREILSARHDLTVAEQPFVLSPIQKLSRMSADSWERLSNDEKDSYIKEVKQNVKDPTAHHISRSLGVKSAVADRIAARMAAPVTPTQTVVAPNAPIAVVETPEIQQDILNIGNALLANGPYTLPENVNLTDVVHDSKSDISATYQDIIDNYPGLTWDQNTRTISKAPQKTTDIAQKANQLLSNGPLHIPETADFSTPVEAGSNVTYGDLISQGFAQYDAKTRTLRVNTTPDQGKGLDITTLRPIRVKDKVRARATAVIDGKKLFWVATEKGKTWGDKNTVFTFSENQDGTGKRITQFSSPQLLASLSPIEVPKKQTPTQAYKTAKAPAPEFVSTVVDSVEKDFEGKTVTQTKLEKKYHWSEEQAKAILDIYRERHPLNTVAKTTVAKSIQLLPTMEAEAKEKFLGSIRTEAQGEEITKQYLIDKYGLPKKAANLLYQQLTFVGANDASTIRRNQKEVPGRGTEQGGGGNAGGENLQQPAEEGRAPGNTELRENQEEVRDQGRKSDNRVAILKFISDYGEDGLVTYDSLLESGFLEQDIQSLLSEGVLDRIANMVQYTPLNSASIDEILTASGIEKDLWEKLALPARQALDLIDQGALSEAQAHARLRDFAKTPDLAGFISRVQEAVKSNDFTTIGQEFLNLPVEEKLLSYEGRTPGRMAYADYGHGGMLSVNMDDASGSTKMLHFGIVEGKLIDYSTAPTEASMRALLQSFGFEYEDMSTEPKEGAEFGVLNYKENNESKVVTLSAQAHTTAYKLQLNSLASKAEASDSFTDQLGIPPERNEQGQLLAPNGQPSNLDEWQWRVVRTTQFKDWFGDWQFGTSSRALDSNGEPAVLYAPAEAPGNVFEAKEIVLTAIPTEASTYTVPVFARMESLPVTPRAITDLTSRTIYAPTSIDTEHVYESTGENIASAIDGTFLSTGEYAEPAVEAPALKSAYISDNPEDYVYLNGALIPKSTLAKTLNLDKLAAIDALLETGYYEDLYPSVEMERDFLYDALESNPEDKEAIEDQIAQAESFLNAGSDVELHKVEELDAFDKEMRRLQLETETQAALNSRASAEDLTDILSGYNYSFRAIQDGNEMLVEDKDLFYYDDIVGSTHVVFVPKDFNSNNQQHKANLAQALEYESRFQSIPRTQTDAEYFDALSDNDEVKMRQILDPMIEALGEQDQNSTLSYSTETVVFDKDGNPIHPSKRFTETRVYYSAPMMEVLPNTYQERPETTQEQRDVAEAALRDIEGLHWVKNRISPTFRSQGSVSLRGYKIEDLHELAALAQVYRDPRFETMRFFLLKDGVLVDHFGLTSRLAGGIRFRLGNMLTTQEVEALPEETRAQTVLDASKKGRDTAYQYLRSRMTSAGATQYVILHNHPASAPLPSTGDYNFTREIQRNIPGFAGHIIIDTNAYSVLNTDWTEKPYRVYLAPQEVIQDGRKSYRIFYEEITPTSMVTHRKLDGHISNLQSALAYVDKKNSEYVTRRELGEAEQVTRLPYGEIQTEDTLAKLANDMRSSDNIVLIGLSGSDFDDSQFLVPTDYQIVTGIAEFPVNTLSDTEATRNLVMQFRQNSGSHYVIVTNVPVERASNKNGEGYFTDDSLLDLLDNSDIHGVFNSDNEHIEGTGQATIPFATVQEVVLFSKPETLSADYYALNGEYELAISEAMSHSPEMPEQELLRYLVPDFDSFTPQQQKYVTENIKTRLLQNGTSWEDLTNVPSLEDARKMQHDAAIGLPVDEVLYSKLDNTNPIDGISGVKETDVSTPDAVKALVLSDDQLMRGYLDWDYRKRRWFEPKTEEGTWYSMWQSFQALKMQKMQTYADSLYALKRMEMLFARIRPDLRDQLQSVLRTANKIGPEYALQDFLSPYLQEELVSGRTGVELQDFKRIQLTKLFDFMKANKLTEAEVHQFMYSLHAIERNYEIAQRNPLYGRFVWATDNAGNILYEKGSPIFLGAVFKDGVEDGQGSGLSNRAAIDGYTHEVTQEHVPGLVKQFGSVVVSIRDIRTGQVRTQSVQSYNEIRLNPNEIISSVSVSNPVKPELWEASQMVYGLLSLNRDRMVSGNLLSQETRQLWENTYKYYIPLKHIEEDNFGISSVRLSVGGSESKRATGRTSYVEESLPFIINHMESTIVRANKNEVLGTLVKFLRAISDTRQELDANGRVAREVSTLKYQGSTLNTDFTSKERDEKGQLPLFTLDGRDYRPSIGANGMVKYQMTPAFGAGDVLRYKEGDKEHYVRISYMPLMQGFLHLSGRSAQSFADPLSIGATNMVDLSKLTVAQRAAVRTWNFFAHPDQGYRKLFRFMGQMYTAFSPYFLMYNAQRDALTAILNVMSEYHKVDPAVWAGLQEKGIVPKDIPPPSGISMAQDLRRGILPRIARAEDIPVVGEIASTIALGTPFVTLWGNAGRAMKHIIDIEDGKKAHSDFTGEQLKWINYYDEMRKAGGLVQFYTAANYRNTVETIKKGLDTKTHKSKQVMYNAARLLENQNRIVESATRLAAYVAARDAGMSVQRAASLSKNLTVNFNRKGLGDTKPAQFMKDFYLFANANIQGITRFGQVLGRNPKALLTRGPGMMLWFGIINALVNRWMGGDDDDGVAVWDKYDDTAKMRNAYILMGKDRAFALKLPFGFNIPFFMGQALESSIEYLCTGGERGKNPGTNFLAILGSIFSYVDVAGTGVDISSKNKTAKQTGFDAINVFVPALARPATQLLFNRSWTGNPIHPESTNPKIPSRSLTYGRAGLPAEWLARKVLPFIGVDVSPDSIRYLFDTSVGGFLRFGMELWDLGQKLASVHSRPAEVLGKETANLALSSIPFIKSMFPEFRDRYTRDLFEDYNNTLLAYKKFYNSQTLDGKAALRAQYGEAITAWNSLHNYEKRISEQTANLKRMRQDDTKTWEQIQAVQDKLDKDLKVYNAKFKSVWDKYGEPPVE